MRSNILVKLTTPLFAVALALGIAACDNDPLEVDEHPEAAGIVIRNAATGQEITRQVGELNPFNNPLLLPAGGAVEVEILYIDEDDPNNLFLPAADEGEETRVVVADPSIATYADHEDHGDFSGLKAGTTTATVQLYHGSHSDYSSGSLNIVVQ